MSEQRDATVQGAQASAIAKAGAIKRLASGEWLAEGYRSALARFRQAERKHDEPKETFIALFETLSWASSVGDWLHKRRQGTLPDVVAIDWIRDRVLHQWADAIEPRPIIVGPITSSRSGTRPEPLLVWHWRDRSEIPDPDKKFESPDGADAYDDRLAGHRVAEVLDEIERFLNRR